MIRKLTAMALLLAPAEALGREQPLTFAQAADAAAASPLLQRGQRARATLEEASRSSPRVDANPTISIQLGARVLPANERMAEGTLGVSQALSTEGAARLRQQALAAEARTAGATLQGQKMSLRLQAARGWLELWAAQRLLAAAKQDAEAARRSQRAVEALVAAHERTRTEALVAKRQAEEASLRALSAEGALAEARAMLKGELGLAADATPVATGEPPEVVAPTEAEQQAAVAEAASMPEVRARSLLAAEERVRAAEERAARGSRLTVGAQAQRDAIGATVLLGTLSAPINLFDVAAREEAPRRAAALRAEGEAAVALNRARGDLLIAFHDVEHSDETLQAIDRGLLPAAEQAAAALDRAFAAGEVTILEKIDGQRSLIEARARQIAAQRDRAWARIRASVLAQAARGGAP